MSKFNVFDAIDYLKTRGQLFALFYGYGKIYLFTTENISGFINKYDLGGKIALSVCGSGDQALNLYLNGAVHVTQFDSNPLTYLNYKLKKQAIIHLTYNEFINFFHLNDENLNVPFNEKLFEKFKRYLDRDTYQFFDHVLSLNKEGINYYLSDIYYDSGYDTVHLKGNSNYLIEQNFKRLKKILPTTQDEFLHSNLTRLFAKIEGRTYDMILLSNIADYLPDDLEQHLDEYFDIVWQLRNNLTDGGIMEVAYIYYPDASRKDDLIQNSDERDRLFRGEDGFYYDKVKSYTFDYSYDRILALRK